LNRQWHRSKVTSKVSFQTVVILAVILAIVATANLNQVKAIWYADLGTVQMAKVELSNFPNAGWAGQDIVPKLGQADAMLHTAL